MYETIIGKLPSMLAGEKMTDALRVLPDYDVGITGAPVPERLMAMSDLYKIYEPSRMSIEIYTKLYLGLFHSISKKGTKTAIKQQQENRKAVLGAEYNGIMGGADSFTLIGESGIGKSAGINRAISLMKGEQVIVTDKPYLKFIPVICVQCPFDSSVKGLLLEILRKVDEALGSKYHEGAIRARMTVDMLIGSVSQVALNHIGLIVVDEIQNVVSNKNGRNLVGVLTQLINNSGISICMVGTPESAVFFESTMFLARRSLGLQFGAMKYDDGFQNLCRLLLSYRYVAEPFDITEGLLLWLYEHSRGNVSALVSLVHDAQEYAIINGTERLDKAALNSAYDNNLAFMHDHLNAVELINHPKPRKAMIDVPVKTVSIPELISIEAVIEEAKSDGTDAMKRISDVFDVEEISV